MGRVTFSIYDFRFVTQSAQHALVGEPQNDSELRRILLLLAVLESILCLEF